MGIETAGRILLAVGVVLAIAGGLLMLLSRLSIFSGFGNLPGDIRIQGQGFSCFIPIASMLLVSVVLTIALNILARLFNRLP